MHNNTLHYTSVNGSADRVSDQRRSTPSPIEANRRTDDDSTTAGVAARPAVDLLREIVSTSLGPLSRLGDTLNLTLDQVSEWIAQPENRRNVFNLLGLLDAQTQLLIAQQRVMAAARLAQLANDDSAPPETVRRACKDLLSMRLIERSRAKERRGGDDLAPLHLPVRNPLASNGSIMHDLRATAAWPRP